MNYLAVAGLITFISTSVGAIFVYSKNPKNIIHITWTLFNLCSALWGYGIFKCFTSYGYVQALFWARFLNLSAIFINVFLFHFCLAFTNKNEEKRKELFVYYFIGISYFILAIIFKGSFVKDLHPILSFVFYPTPGSAYFFFPIYYMYLLIYSVKLLLKDFLNASANRKNKIKYLLFGIALSFIGGATTFPAVFNIPIPPVGTFVAPVFVFCLAYAVIKYQLLDIRIAITRSGIFLSTYLIVLGLPFILGYFWQSWLIRRFGINWWMVLLGISTIAGIIGHFITRYLREKTEAIFFKKHRLYRENLLTSSREMVFKNKLGELLESIAKTIMNNSAISHMEIFLYDLKLESYESVKKAGDVPKGFGDNVFFEDNPLISLIFKSKSYNSARIKSEYSDDEGRIEEKETNVLICDDLLKDETILYSNTISLMELGKIRDTIDRMQASLIFPYLAQNDERLGFVILGPRTDGQIYSVDDIEVLETVANQSSIAIKNAQTLERQKNTLIQTIAALVKTIEEKDEYTKGHSESVKRYCLWIVEEMGNVGGWEDLKYNAGKIEEAALLHDVGKIAIPDNILKSQKDFKHRPMDTEEERRLKEEAFEKIKSHPTVGDRILAYIEDLNYHRDIIRHHHERWDGRGYPDGKKGEEIPRESRIMAVADTYDAITSSRSYDPSRSIEKAIAILEYNKGAQFDPRVVDAFIRVLRRRFVFEQIEVDEFLETFRQNGER